MKIRQLLKEAAGVTAAFAFGRFNPAHQGHIAVWQTVEKAGVKWYIGTNPSTIGPNDPLTFEQKSAWMEEIYPPIAGHIVPEQSVVTLAAKIYKDLGGKEDATIAYITDETDWAWSGKLLNQYNGVEGKHGYYKFAQIVHVPSPRVSSATALRDAARADDKVAFYHASGTDPKLRVNGKTYFDTVKEACAKYPLPVKKTKKVAEMDSQGYTGSRDSKSKSKYGSRDNYELGKGKEHTAKMTTADKMMKDAHDAMMKAMSQEDKVKKGWAHSDTLKKKGVDEAYQFKGGFPFDVDHMPGAVHRNADMTTDNVKTKDKAEWDRAVNSINAKVFDDMSDFRTDRHGETVTGNSAVWAKWDNATQTGWFNAKGRPLKPWPVKEQGVVEGSEERGQNRLWAMITDYEQRAKATKNDIKKAHYMKMASELRGKLKTIDEQGVAEGTSPFGNKVAGPFASEERAKREASRISKELGVKRYVEKTSDGKYIVVKKQGMAEGSSTTWEVSFDYGPHMTKTVKVKARSEEEAAAKVEKAAEKKGLNIMINSVTPADLEEGWKDKVGAAALAGAMATGGQAHAGPIGNAVAQGLGAGIASAAVSSVANKSRNARDTEFAKQIPDEADRAIYLKALKHIKYSRAVAHSDPALMGANAVSEIKFKKLKQAMAEKYNIQMPVKEQSVSEGVDQSYKVTYDIYGSNKEKPLYTKTRTVRAKSEQEAISILRKLVGGTNYRVEKQGVKEEKQRLDPKCWDGYKKQGTKMKGDTRVNNCVKENFTPMQIALMEGGHSLYEDASTLNVGDPVIITGKGIEFEGTTGEIADFGQDKRFVIVDLYNHGKHSFHSSDVSYNDYADSDEEEARMYDAGEFRDMDESDEKIGGRYDPEEFDAMVNRLKKIAKAGPMKTVWDPVKRVYKNVPDTDKQKKIAEAVVKVVEVIKQRKGLWKNK